MKPIIYLFLASILLLTACAAPKNLEFKGIESLKIEKASFGKNIFIFGKTIKNGKSKGLYS